jgi:penicillin-binding protein 2
LASTTAGRAPDGGRRRRRGGAGDAEGDSAVEPYRVTPKLARRLAILGAVLLVGFAALVTRLWTLQVLAGSEYAARANSQQTREVPVPAARGAVVDRNGDALVTSAAVTAVDLYPSGLPKVGETRRTELETLARITHVPFRTIAGAIYQRVQRNDTLDPIVVRSAAAGPLVTYLQERASQFPGVSLGQTYVRRYPHGDLAAQLFGVVGPITPGEANSKAYSSLPVSDEIGQSGIEAAFNSYLQGLDGSARVRVDSFGRQQSRRALVKAATPGQTVRLTLDTGLQRTAQNALAYGIQLAHNKGQWAADGGAIVAMDPQTGAILAAASSPTYNPAVYAGRRSQHALAEQGLTNATAFAHNYPLYDRALDGEYPPGSIFKPLTAIAALQEKIVSPNAFEPCTGTYVAPEDLSHHVWHNWDPNVDQGMTMPEAIAYSCDTYFYRLGNSFYLLPPDRGQPEQSWARKFGFGRQPPLEKGLTQASGLLPTIAWKHHTFTRKTDPTNWRIDRLWKPGDSIQLAIGQGDLLVTPLQMARFYSAIANGGKLVQPHLLLDVENQNKTLVPTPAPAAPRPIAGLSQSTLGVVQSGLYGGTHLPLGTSYGVFGHFPVAIAGKTGTAQKVVSMPDGSQPELNQSWWCGYGPFNAPKLVVCAVIENGGYGGDVAAPAAERVFAKFFGVNSGQLGYIHSD